MIDKATLPEISAQAYKRPDAKILLGPEIAITFLGILVKSSGALFSEWYTIEKAHVVFRTF